jgi:hypothetical protein
MICIVWNGGNNTMLGVPLVLICFITFQLLLRSFIAISRWQRHVPSHKSSASASTSTAAPSSNGSNVNDGNDNDMDMLSRTLDTTSLARSLSKLKQLTMLISIIIPFFNDLTIYIASLIATRTCLHLVLSSSSSA